MSPRNFVAFLALGVAALTASCGKSGPDPVVVGLNLELTGDIQTIGQSAQNAAELFFAKKNEAGGLKLADGHRPVTLVTADNAANATQAASVAQQQISRENIVAMIGPNSGNCATTASDIAEALKCVMISPWSPDPMTTMDPVAGVPKRYVFRAGATDELQGKIMAQFAAEKLGAKRAAIISDAAQGTAQVAGFKQAFAAAGGEVVDEKVFEAVGKDFPLQVGSIASSSPEVVFVAASCEDTLDILEAAKAAGLNAKFLGTELWNSPQTIRMTALGIDGLYFCRNFDHRDADPQTVKFVEEYTAKYNTPPDDVAALTYDACGLVTAALEKSGKNDREALRESLARTTDFEGVAGTYNFAPGSGDPVKSLPVIEIKSGGMEWVGDFGN